MSERALWLGIALLAVTSTLLPAAGMPVLGEAAAQQEPDECRYDADTGDVVCDYRGDDGGNETSSEPWWASPSIEVGLAVVGLTASAVGGGYTVLKKRRRRQNLRALLDEVDEAYSQHKTRPDEGLPALSQLRETVRDEHDAGRLSDEQFLELDKRVGQRLAKLRLLKLERDLEELPDRLAREVEHVVEDGGRSRGTTSTTSPTDARSWRSTTIR